MTAQVKEILIYKGEGIRMASEPLNQYLVTRNDIKLVRPSTACGRGYYGRWEIRDNKLFLIDLKAYLQGFQEIGLAYLFPEKVSVS